MGILGHSGSSAFVLYNKGGPQNSIYFSFVLIQINIFYNEYGTKLYTLCPRKIAIVDTGLYFLEYI